MDKFGDLTTDELVMALSNRLKHKIDIETEIAEIYQTLTKRLNYATDKVEAAIQILWGPDAVIVGPGTVTEKKELFGNDFKIRQGSKWCKYTATDYY